MTLPKISHPLYDLVIPSNLKKIKVRPMLVREEKILLLARESGTDEDILNAEAQVVNNCIQDDINIEKLTTFDIDFLFLKLRSMSVSNETTYSVIDNEDEQVHIIKINLDDVIVQFPENVDKNIKINDDSGILMKYPESTLFTDKEFFKLEGSDRFEEFTYRCIDKVYFGDEIIIFSDIPKEERREFIESLSINAFQKVKEFLNNMPTLYYKSSYKNSKGTEHTVVLNQLTDFFTL